MADVDPWDRQPGESARAYEAFRNYRDAGPDRSLRKTADALHRNRTLMERWSANWGWVVRADAWDKEQDRLHQVELAKARRRMALSHARIAGAMQAKIVQRLQTIHAEDLTPGQLVSWLQVATTVERLALGEATARTEVTGAGGGPVETLDLGELSVEERAARLDRLVREASRRAGVAGAAGDG
jgi:hypothetical protein